MYPTKSMFDYMSEINRYPRTEGENDIFQSPLPRTSSFSQSTPAQSSSSTETSPDSFSDLTSHLSPPEFRPERACKPQYQGNQWRREHDLFRCDSYESFRADTHRPDLYIDQQSRTFDSQMRSVTPFGSQHSDLNNCVLTEHIYETSPARRQRPIVGRKIITAETPLKTINEFPIWQPDSYLTHTPPKSDQYAPNYELFPSENRGFEFPSPIKTPNPSPLPPKITVSPRMSTPSMTPPPRAFPPRMTRFKEPLVGSSTYGTKMCTFCRKNGETPCVYNTHSVKEKIGNRHVVTCPILRSHICSACGVSGDDAHTITYCPLLRSGNNGQPLQSTTITLKNTRVKSNGRRRY